MKTKIIAMLMALTLMLAGCSNSETPAEPTDGAEPSTAIGTEDSSPTQPSSDDETQSGTESENTDPSETTPGTAEPSSSPQEPSEPGTSSPQTEPPTSEPSESAPQTEPPSTEPPSTAPVSSDGSVQITLANNTATISGSGASVRGSTVTISAGGTYTLSGTLTDGQIVVDTTSNTKVTLILNGVDISCSTSAPIYIPQADETTITLAAGTVNTLRDGQSYTFAAGTDEPDAALFAKDDLRINGTGTLNITANYSNGIGSKDDLVIENGTFTVTAANHGIRGRDSVTIQGGRFTIQAGNDGIQSNNDEAADKGWISIGGGTFNITACHDGIQTERTLTVSGGTFNLTCGGGYTGRAASAEDSYKGFKAGTDLTISGGTITVNSLDDAVHANQNVTVSGGRLELATGDDGIHADNTLTISGGDINISTSFEGIEASIINISSGTVRLSSSDDGINIAGGNDGNNGQFGQDRFSSNENWYLDMSGGYVVVNATGDGLDSNGNAFMSGGTLIINGSTSDWNAAIDYDRGRFEISGGVLVAAGSSGMAQAPSSGSSQASLMVYFDSTQSAGTAVNIKASDGTDILSFVPQKQYTTIVISAPELSSGQSYSVYSGGSVSSAQDGLATGAGTSDSTHLFDVTLSGVTTTVDSNGNPYTRSNRWW